MPRHSLSFFSFATLSMIFRSLLPYPLIRVSYEKGYLTLSVEIKDDDAQSK